MCPAASQPRDRPRDRPLPRLLFVGSVARAWGAEIALLRLVASLRDSARISIVLMEEGPMVARYELAGAEVKILRMPDRALSVSHHFGVSTVRVAAAYLTFGRRLFKLIRVENPDLVLGNSLRGSAIAGIAARAARVPFVWMARDRLSREYLGRSVRIFKTLLRLTSVAVISNSDSTARTIPPGPPNVTIHDPLSLEYFESSPRRFGTVRTVGMVGRLSEWKGQPLFLEAFANVWKQTEVSARIVGGSAGSDSLDIPELRRLATDLRIAEQVEFTGHVDDVRSEYAAVDVLVHASLIPEPFGQVVAEGLASGCVVVATDAGGPAELINDGENGLLFEMGSVESLTNALRAAQAMPEADRAQMVAAAQRTAGRLHPDAIKKEFLDFVEPLCQRKPIRVST